MCFTQVVCTSLCSRNDSDVCLCPLFSVLLISVLLIITMELLFWEQKSDGETCALPPTKLKLPERSEDGGAQLPDRERAGQLESTG